MSIENLNAATVAMNALTGRISDFMDGVDDDLAAHEAAYAALAGDLVGVVDSRVMFSGTVDPNDPAPTEVNGGTFNSIPDLIAASPAFGHVTIILLAGETYQLDGADWDVERRRVHFQGADPNNRAQIVIGTYEAGGSNAPWCIRWWQGATFRFENLDFVLGALAVPAGGWSGWRSIVRNQYCDSVTVHLNNVDFTGEGDMSIVRPFGGAHVNIVARAVVLDGDVSLIGTATLSVTSIVTAAQLTLQNGAAIASGTPTLGENYLLGD